MTRTLIIAAALLLTGCAEKEPAANTDDGRDVVYTTFYPTEYFASRIAGDLVEVVCPVPEDADAIFWKPSRSIIADYQKADLIIVNGAEFEKWVATTTLPESRVVDTAAGFEDEFVTYVTATHSHGAGGEHTHEGIDGHTWVDPVNAGLQAGAIRDAMITRWPEHTDAFRVNAQTLISDLNALNQRFEAINLEGAQLLASHPAYNYLKQRYGWEIDNFDLDPERPIHHIEEITEALDPDRRAIMLWEGEPIAEAVAALEAIGVISVTFSPCELLGDAERAAGEDYLSVMQGNLDRLEAALGEAPGAP